MLVSYFFFNLDFILDGMSIRTSGTVAANAKSSRSHAILQIILKTSSTITLTSTARPSRNNNNPAVPRRLMKEVGKMSRFSRF